MVTWLASRHRHRLQVHRLEGGLLFLELVKRCSLLCEQGLKSRREIGPVSGVRLPRQGVAQPVVTQAVLQGVLPKPIRHRLRVRDRAGEMGDEAPALPSLPAKIVECSGGDDDPAPHDGDPIRHQLRLAQHVRRDDQRRTATPLLVEIAAHVRRGHRVQAGGRLVAEDPIRLVKRGADERHLLRHAARVRGEDRVLAVRELEALEQISDAPAADRLRNTVEESEVVEVLRSGVAAVESRLVRYHP